MSTNSEPRKFRQVSLGPGIPRFEPEPLDLPLNPKPGERCWVCLGRGEMLNEEGDPYPCDACDGTGQIGGGQ